MSLKSNHVEGNEKELWGITLRLAKKRPVGAVVMRINLDPGCDSGQGSTQEDMQEAAPNFGTSTPHETS